MMDLFSLQGKRALVTGASRGLGRAMAESLAAAGADVVCSSSRKSGTDETAAAVKALGREVWQIAADLSSTEGAHRLVDEVTEAVGHIDILDRKEHTSELQSRGHLVCRLLLEK